MPYSHIINFYKNKLLNYQKLTIEDYNLLLSLPEEYIIIILQTYETVIEHLTQFI